MALNSVCSKGLKIALYLLFLPIKRKGRGRLTHCLKEEVMSRMLSRDSEWILFVGKCCQTLFALAPSGRLDFKVESEPSFSALRDMHKQ